MYQWPVPVIVSTRRVPPPYQATVSRLCRRAAATASRGLGSRSLDPRAALAAVGRRRLEQVGLGVELADQAQPLAVAVAEPGDLVGPVGRIADEDEPAVGEPAEHQPQQPDHVLGRGAMPVPLAAVVLLGAVQGDQDRQGPGADGEGEADQDGEHDPLVAVPPGGEGVRGADRVAMAGLAEDVGAGMGDDRVIAGQDDRGVGGEERDDVPGQGQARRSIDQRAWEKTRR